MDLVLFLAIITIPAIAQAFVSINYSKYKEIENKKQISGFEVARKILDEHKLEEVHIVEIRGNLTDHYDQNRKVVRLSTDVFHGTSVASTAIAAHECGHAIQDKDNYSFLKIRSTIYPVVRIATMFSYIIIFIGILAQALDLVYLGIALVGIGLIFQLITLPVEINASERAIEEIKKLKLETDLIGTKKVLNAAAMTYVAGVLSSILELLRLILAFTNNDR